MDKGNAIANSCMRLGTLACAESCVTAMRVQLSSLALLASMMLSMHAAVLGESNDSACQWNSPGGLYDFSPLQRFDFTGPTYPDSGLLTSLSVCGGLADREAAPCVASLAQYQMNGSISACMVEGSAMGSSVSATAYGIWQPAAVPLNWTYISPNYPPLGVQYQMQGGEWSNQGGQTGYYGSIVQLQCDQNQGQLVAIPWPYVGVTLTLFTPLACKPAWQPTTCGYFGVSYASLMGQVITGTDGSSAYKYSLAVCGGLPANTGGCQIGPDQLSPAACRTSTDVYSGPSVTTGLYSPDPLATVWSFMDNSNPTFGTQYRIGSNTQCPAGAIGQTYTTIVQFICNPQGDSQPMRVYSAPFHWSAAHTRTLIYRLIFLCRAPRLLY